MIVPPFLAVRLSRSLCLVALVGVASLSVPSVVWGQSPMPQLPPVLPRMDNTAPLTPEQIRAANEAQQRYHQDAHRYYTPQIAQLSRSDDRTPVIYSRDLNRILSVAVPPDDSSDGKDPAWMGTRLGIKRVENGKIVRHYTGADGLTGEIVTRLAADGQGAVALVSRAHQAGSDLCWWDARTDRWRPILRLSGVHEGSSDSNQWRFLLTPTRVIVVPPNLAEREGYGQNEPLLRGLTFWKRADLAAGRDTPRTWEWDDSLRLRLRPTGGLYTPPQTRSACAWNENVLLGTSAGLIWIPAPLLDATAAPAKSDPPPADFLPALPDAPPSVVFLAGFAVEDLQADQKEIWAVVREAGGTTTQVRRFAPVLAENALAGLKQTLIAPPANSPAASLLTGSSVRFGAVSSRDVWLLTSEDRFLHEKDGQWEALDENGVPLTDAKAVEANRNRPFFGGFDDGYRFDMPALVAPPPSRLPDRVVQAWLTPPFRSPWNAPRGAEFTSQRRMAWLHQRFPEYLTPPSDLPQSAPVSVVLDLPDANQVFGAPYQFVRDPADPQTVWYGASRSRATLPPDTPPDKRDTDGVLWRIPAADVPPWRFQAEYGSQPGGINPVVGPVSLERATAWTLPSLPATLRLPVNSLIPRPDGLYVGTQIGVLRMTGRALAGTRPARGDIAWVPRATEQGMADYSFLSGALVQAGPNGGLFANASSSPDAPLLRLEKSASNAAGQFLPDKTLPAEFLVAGTSAGLFTRPVKKTPLGNGGYSLSQSERLRWTPVEAGGVPRPQDARQLSLRADDRSGDAQALPFKGPGYPFVNEYAAQTAVTGSIVWFSGYIEPPATPRYTQTNGGARALAGYDLKRGAWTRPLELPESHVQTPVTVTEQDGRTYAAFFAPDACLWRYAPAADTWSPVAPALPDEPLPNGNDRDTPPRLWWVKGKDVWMLFRRRAYHLVGGAKPWQRFDGPETFFATQANYLEPVTTAAAGDGLWVGGRSGLWRLDRKSHVWTEVAPTTDLLPGSHTLTYVQSVAADAEQVYLTGGTDLAHSSSEASGFLMTWDKKTQRFSVVPPSALGLDRYPSYSRVFSDGSTVFYHSQGMGERLLRRDPRTGTWVALDSNAPRPQVYADTRHPGVSYRARGTVLEQVDATGKTEVLLDTASLPEAAPNTPSDLRRGSQITQVVAGREAVFFKTADDNVYRFKRGGPPEKQPLPHLPNGALIESADGTLYLWNNDTIAVVPQ